MKAKSSAIIKYSLHSPTCQAKGRGGGELMLCRCDHGDAYSCMVSQRVQYRCYKTVTVDKTKQTKEGLLIFVLKLFFLCFFFHSSMSFLLLLLLLLMLMLKKQKCLFPENSGFQKTFAV